MIYPNSYVRNGAGHNMNETLADSLAQVLLKKISREFTNMSPEEKTVSENYIWNVRLEHTGTYIEQEVSIFDERNLKLGV